MSLTSQLLSALPESSWGEASRRLTLLPELRRLAEDDPSLLDAFCALSRDARAWRPGRLALAIYQRRHPESRPDAEAWLLNEGRERLSEAYARLVSSEAALDPVDEALLAALALRVRGQVTIDWHATAADAHANPARWRLPIQYLAGLVEALPPLVSALLQHSPETAALAAHALAVNLDAEATLRLLTQEPLPAPAAHWLSCLAAFKTLGQRDLARALAQAVAQSIQAAANGWQGSGAELTRVVETAELLAASEWFDVAHDPLVEAWTRIRRARAEIAQHIGRLANEAGHHAVALAAYQDALVDQPDDADLQLGLAQTLIELNEPQQALSALESIPDAEPEKHLLAARAYLALHQGDEARAELAQFPLSDPDVPPSLLAQASHLFTALNDSPNARAAMQQAAERAQTDPVLYLNAAQLASAAGAWNTAEALAFQAAAFAPHHAETREMVGRALLETRHPEQALAHFQAALAYEPLRLSAALGLARAALAAHQLSLASEAAQHVLTMAAGPDAQPEMQGEAHILLGETLSALNQEEQAFEHFSRASALMPSAPGPWRAMARHLRARNDNDRAIIALEAGRQALKLCASPDTAPLLLDLADAYLASGRRGEALTALREACAADPNSPLAHRQLGALLRRSGQAGEAVRALRHALTLRPGDWMALHELGLALEESHQFVEAWAAYQQAVLARPDDPAPYFDLGRLTLELNAKHVPDASPAQAVSALREAVQRAPDNAEKHALLARAEHLAGEPERALASYQRALRLAPRRTDWSLGLGQVCLQLNRPEIAVAALQEAVQYAPHNPAVHLAFTEAYMQSQLWSDAVRSAEAALRLDPENVELHRMLAHSMERLGQAGRAAQVWERAVRLEPRNTDLQIRYARCLLGLERMDEARGVLAQALALAPDSAEVHLAAGQALMDLGEHASAYDTLAKAVELGPRNAQAHAAFGQAAMRAGRYETAHAAFLRAAELQPENAAHLRQAGEALWQLDRLPTAVALWQRAILIDPNDRLTLAHLGAALLRTGQYAEALAALEKAVHQNPDDAALAREAAHAALEVGELEKAEQLLENAINLAPGDAEARYLLGQVCERHGDGDKALALYRQASQLQPGEGRYRAASGNVLANLGHTAEALEAMRAAVHTSRESAEVQEQAGLLFLKAGQLEEAAEAFQHWVETQPRSGNAHLALAQALTCLAESHQIAKRAGMRIKGFADAPSRLSTALHQAAALGADPQAVRYWLGRAKAATGQPAEARQLLASLIAGTALHEFNAAEFYRALGAALRQAGEPEQAREALQLAIDLHDHSAPASQPELVYLELGLTHAALNDARGAVVAFKRAVAANPHSAIAHFHLAEAFHALGDRADAAQVLQRAIALNPDVAAWHWRLAKWQQAQQQAGALAHFQKAAQLEPDNADYNADLARVLAKDGDLNAAATFFRRATEARPDDDQLWTERGQAHLALGDHTSAGEAFTKAVALAPENVPALLGAARVSAALGNLHLALNQAETAVRNAPHDADALICLADVKAIKGDVAAAEQHYAAAAARLADPSPALLALGRLQLKQGKLAPATDTLQRALKTNPSGEELIATLGEVRAAAGDHQGAVQAYREAIRLAPRNAHYHLKLGRTLRAQGQLDQAIAHLLQAREIAPHNDENLREIGLVFEQRKQFDRALEMYQLAIKAAPRNANNYARAGIALKHLKDYAASVAALERAVALDPNHLEATKQLAAVTAMNIIHGDAGRQPLTANR